MPPRKKQPPDAGAPPATGRKKTQPGNGEADRTRKGSLRWWKDKADAARWRERPETSEPPVIVTDDG